MKRVIAILLLLLSSVGLEALEPKVRADSVRDTISDFAKLQDKEVSEVNKLKKMFKKGQSSGQLKMIYSTAPEVEEPYATAIGGIMKYELAQYHGFNAGAAVYISYDIPFASGEGTKQDSELSSSKGHYVDMGEAYLNYKYENFNFRAGRQTLDTPLADRDDVRMIQNSFEAYVGTYEYEGLILMAGNIQRWHGYGAGLDNEWVKTGSKGTNFTGIAYANGLEVDAWYYNITGMTNTAYFDLGLEYGLNENVLLHTMVQYLHESELQNSGVEASIYGFIGEVVVYGVGLRLSMNKAERCEGKKSFSGFGGGTLFTNMDTYTMDEMTQDREVTSYVIGTSYDYEEFNFLYAYGDFSGGEDTNRVKAHIVEQNIGLGYNVNEEFIVGAIFARLDDVDNSANSWSRTQLRLNYNFK